MGGRTPHSGGTDPHRGGVPRGGVRGVNRPPSRGRAGSGIAPSLLHFRSQQRQQRAPAPVVWCHRWRHVRDPALPAARRRGAGGYRAGRPPRHPWGERPRACRAGGRQQGRPRQASCGVRACVRACVRASVRACVRAGGRARGWAGGAEGGRSQQLGRSRRRAGGGVGGPQSCQGRPREEESSWRAGA